MKRKKICSIITAAVVTASLTVQGGYQVKAAEKPSVSSVASSVRGAATNGLDLKMSMPNTQAQSGNIAATYTAEGAAEAQKIRNTTDKEVTILLSEAQKNAEVLKAEGEAEYMRILSEAYQDSSRTDFYSFVRSLDALKESVKGTNKTVILDKDSPIAQIFY